MLNIIIPAAGEGRRFTEAGYGPKPFIDVCGKSMVNRVMDSLRPSRSYWFTILYRDSCASIVPGERNGTALGVGTTDGATDTVLRYFGLPGGPPPDLPTLIGNVDLWLAKGVIDDFLAWCDGPDCSLITFPSTNPHHSYVRLSDECLVTEIKEKQVISDEAVAGVYWFRSGTMLEDYCRRVLASGDTYNGEFYLSSVIAAMVADGLSVTTFPVGWEDVAMLGTPEELAVFEQKVADGRIVL